MMTRSLKPQPTQAQRAALQAQTQAPAIARPFLQNPVGALGRSRGPRLAAGRPVRQRSVNALAPPSRNALRSLF